ncbi:hypothetical protein [Pseudobythopirellula maris]|uniref:hypothetical protein n=1 Tax=Pseudobythopirellula maris TaxID=2527991 RepID=UPI0011B5054F|nr:hypothetical protein [Pseudobythopirellula maris]
MPAIDPRNIEVVDPAQAAIFRSKSVAERVAMIGASNRTARAMIAATARALNPQWSDREIETEVARRMAGGPAGPAASRR